MKTKNKILLGLATTSGVVASFGAAYAIYVSPKVGKTFNIGIGTVKTYTQTDDKVTYSFGDIELFKNETCAEGDKIDSPKLSPDLNKVYLKAPLSFSYNGDLTNPNAVKQDYMLGTLKVSVTLDSSIANLGNATVSAKLQGYDTIIDGTGVSETYFTAHKQDDFFSSNNNTFSSDKITLEADIGTAIDASSIYCVIGLDLSSTIKDDEFVDVAGIAEAFKVSLSWGEYTTTGVTNADSQLNPDLWITGGMNDWTTKMNNDFRLVPNLKAQYYAEKSSSDTKTTKTDGYAARVEWMYKGLTTFNRLKVYDNTLDENAKWISCRNPTTEETGNKGVKSESDGNAVLTIQDGYAYDVYYKRGAIADNVKNFWVSASGTNKS